MHYYLCTPCLVDFIATYVVSGNAKAFDFGGILGRLGCVLARGASLARLESLLASWGVLGASWRVFGAPSRVWAPFGSKNLPA